VSGDAQVSTTVGADSLGSEIRALFTELSHGGDIDPTPGTSTVASVATSTCHEAAESGRERTLAGEAGRAAVGAWVRFQLRVRGPEVREVRYRAYGCPYTLATCEWLARALTGRTLAARSPSALAQAIGHATAWADRLGVPPERLGRLLVIEDALRAALADGERSVQRTAQSVRQSDNP
jgi:NifU-like protein involved in Fe-S cluster formation